jgi:hypothetical protein
VARRLFSWGDINQISRSVQSRCTQQKDKVHKDPVYGVVKLSEPAASVGGKEERSPARATV